MKYDLLLTGFMRYNTCICTSTPVLTSQSLLTALKHATNGHRTTCIHNHTHTNIYIYTKRKYRATRLVFFCIGSGQRESNGKICHERPVSVHTHKTDGASEQITDKRNEDDGKMCSSPLVFILSPFRAIWGCFVFINPSGDG